MAIWTDHIGRLRLRRIDRPEAYRTSLIARKSIPKA